jgi:opacity protein-like surface antigen
LVVAGALAPATARADWQLKPFGGVTFGGGSPFTDLDRVEGKPKFNLGMSVQWLGEVVGLEGDVATTSGFFTGEERNIARSHVATVTGNVVVALPRRMAEYSLRPYAVAGAGFAHVSFRDGIEALVYGRALSAWDVGGGATGFVSDSVGLNWDVRFFRTLRPQEPETTTSAIVEKRKLSFWRVSMGFSIRL